ncbi:MULTISPECIES: response regulator [Burkholderiaceae]|uniref:response regulator n=1 Tax=Burkholderiaceae TaxID=119060 RepID=UPI0014211AA0|nr:MULTISPECIES: response regulator [Burkholderiaceae]NIF54590.1 response regulator [Burkholderia sp. Ax-1724]NIF79950.1 response regulator [Paraburkholderia sp. Cy-641]
MNQTILIVDDDPVVRELVSEYLQGRGFKVVALEHGMALQRSLLEERPALVVLDIMMPELDGISALRALRVAGDDLPVILLTARAEPIDRVIGLELGADDYLGKPFEPSELVARIRTVLRRRGTVAPGAPEQRAPYRFGHFEVNFPERELRRDGERIMLRSSEFAMLKVFVTHAMTVLTRAQLLEKLRGNDETHRNRSLDVSIWRLRRLIEADPSAPRYVQTVWGRGYVFVPDGEIGATGRGLAPPLREH